MEKGAPPSMFVNDGSFMERFKQLQQEKDKETDKVAHAEESKPVKIMSGISNPRPSVNNNSSIGIKTNDAQKKGGKLAFSLKQKSKLLAPPVLGTEDDEDERDTNNEQGFGSVKRQKLEQGDTPAKSSKPSDVGNGCLIYIYMCLSGSFVEVSVMVLLFFLLYGSIFSLGEFLLSG